MQIKDHVIFGQMIIKWAKAPGAPRPGTTAALLAEIAAHLTSIGDPRSPKEIVEFDAGETGVMFHDLPDAPAGSVRINLPSAAVIDETIPPGEYPLPDEYDDIPYGPVTRIDLDKETAETFRQARIADYATAKCH